MSGSRAERIKRQDRDEGYLRDAWGMQEALQTLHGVKIAIYQRQAPQVGVYHVRVAAHVYEKDTAPRKVALVQLQYPTAENGTFTGTVLAAMQKLDVLLQAWAAQEQMTGEAAPVEDLGA